MFALLCCTLLSTSRSDTLFHPGICDLPSLVTVNVIQLREPYYLLTKISTVSNRLLVFLRHDFGIELKSCIRNRLIFKFRGKKKPPRRPPNTPRRMAGMKAKMFMSSKFLIWVKERSKKCSEHPASDMNCCILSHKTWHLKVISIGEINLSFWFKELSLFT